MAGRQRDTASADVQGSSEYDSGSQGVDAFKIYNNSSFNPDA